MNHVIRQLKVQLGVMMLVPWLAAAMPLLPAAHAQNADMASLRKLALDLVNEARAAENLPPLELEKKLNEAAQAHAADMLARDYYAHETPEGKTVSDRFQAVGGSKWLLTAENIAKCDGCDPPLTRDYVRQMQEGWMNSPGHRANILRKGLDTFGFGMTVGSDGTLYAVQNFAGAGTPQGAGQGADLTPVSPEEQAALALEKVNERRKAAGVQPLKASEPLTKAARKLAPDPGDPDFKVRGGDDIYDALPKAEQNNWSSLTIQTASCGGCGVKPVAADVEYFTGQWLAHKDYGAALTSGDVTHMGFAMVANGKGQKLGVGLIGTHR
jgi:uncharacterized protein YkwD